MGEGKKREWKVKEVKKKRGKKEKEGFNVRERKKREWKVEDEKKGEVRKRMK